MSERLKVRAEIGTTVRRRVEGEAVIGTRNLKRAKVEGPVTARCLLVRRLHRKRYANGQNSARFGLLGGRPRASHSQERECEKDNEKASETHT